MQRFALIPYIFALCLCCVVMACGDDSGEDPGGDGNDAANETSHQNGDEGNQNPVENQDPGETSNDEQSSNEESNANQGSHDLNDQSTTNDGGGANDESQANDGNDDAGAETDKATVCRQSCEDASVCGNEDEWACVDGVCQWEYQEPSASCDGNDECIALYSGWLEPCQNQEGCAITQACIEHQGEGFCAYAEGEHIDCETLSMERMTMDRFGESGEVVACGNPYAICEPELRYCVEGCQSDGDCVHPGVDTCVDGVCRCGSDAACEGLELADTCYDGVCGCSGDEVCTDATYDVCA